MINVIAPEIRPVSFGEIFLIYYPSIYSLINPSFLDKTLYKYPCEKYEKILHMIVPKTIVGTIYIITLMLLGTDAANIPTIIMDIKIEIKVDIPVAMIV